MRLTPAAILLSLASPALAQVSPPVLGVSPAVSTLTTGTVLRASASISADGRYVTLHVHPSFSQLEGISTFSAGGQRIAAGPVALPLATTATTASPPTVPTPAPIPAASSPAPAPAEADTILFAETDKTLLTTAIPALKLQDKSLKQAVQNLADLTKQNIVLGYRGLEQSGIDVNAPHSFDLPPGSLKDTLQSLLTTAAPNARLVIAADDHVIQIMSQSQADNVIVTRIYYTEDLIYNMPKILASKSAGATTPPAAQPAAHPNPLPTYDDVFGYRTPGRPAAQLAGGGGQPRYSTNIIEMITTTLRPEIWKINGGKIGEIAVVGNQVTIRAPLAVQAILDGPKHYDPNARPLYIGYSPSSGAAHTLP